MAVASCLLCYISLFFLWGVWYTQFNKSKFEEHTEMKNSIGDMVTVTIDRPLGSYHPEYRGMRYPINYGYVNGVIAPDGEEQDTYILGVDEPVKEFTGRKIAIVHRMDDCEDKWVIAPEGVSFTLEEIKEAVHFQERYFHSEIELC